MMKMVNIIKKAVIILLFSIGICYSQEYDDNWEIVYQTDSNYFTHNKEIVNVLIDNCGNVITVSNYIVYKENLGVNIIDETTDSIGIHISKHNKYGVLMWVKDFKTLANIVMAPSSGFPSTHSEIKGLNAKINTNNEIIIHGVFLGSVDFGMDFLNQNFIRSSGNGANGTGDHFVIKLDSDGNSEWIKRIGERCIGNSTLDIDNFGNIYLSGYNDSVIGYIYNNDSSTPINNISIEKGNYILSISNTGNIRWIKNIQGDKEFIKNIIINKTGEIILTGIFKENIGVNPDYFNIANPMNIGVHYYPGNTINPPENKTVIVKYNNLGEYLISYEYALNLSSISSSVDSNNNLYLSGIISGANNVINSNTYNDNQLLILKLNEDINTILNHTVENIINKIINSKNVIVNKNSSEYLLLLKSTIDTINNSYSVDLCNLDLDLSMQDCNLISNQKSGADIHTNNNNLVLGLRDNSINKLIYNTYVKYYYNYNEINILESCNNTSFILDVSYYDSLFWNNEVKHYEEIVFNNLGYYELEVYLNGCHEIERFLVDSAKLDFNISFNNPCFNDELLVLLEGGESYNISGPNNFISTDSIFSILNYNKSHLGLYYLEILFSNDCKLDTVFTPPHPSIECFNIVDIITPNDDGLNDSWVLDLLDFYPNNSVSIFNRWGSEIFIASPYMNDFNGTPNTGLLIDEGSVPNGSYFYIIDLGIENKKPITGVLEIQK